MDIYIFSQKAIEKLIYYNDISVSAENHYYPNQIVFHKVFDELNNLKT